MRRWPALLFAGMLFIACPSEDAGVGTPSSSIERVKLAYARTADAGTARTTITGSITIVDQFTIEGDGVIDLEDQRGRTSLHIRGTPDVDALGLVDLIHADSVAYARSLELSRRLAAKEWVSMDTRDSTAGGHIGLEVLAHIAWNDPFVWLHFLLGVDEVEELGSREIGGVPTTHYRVVLDLQRAARQMPSGSPDVVVSSMFRLHTWGKKDEIRCEVWLDAGNRVRRQKMRFTYNESPLLGRSIDMTVDLSGFGGAVDIAVPPSSRVSDLYRLERTPEP